MEKLGLMYKTQMDTLRSRLERRVNRIPNTWREQNILDLVDKHSGASEPKKTTAAPPEQTAPRPVGRPRVNPAMPPPQSIPTKGVKRPRSACKSSLLYSFTNLLRSNEITSDKENQAEQLNMPKKRTKVTATRAVKSPPEPAATATRATRATRATSRKVAAPEVLSPKSNNSRAVAQGRTRRQR